MSRTLLFGSMKDEAPFLLEWLAHHKALGFDEVHVAANASNDTTVELLERLQDHGELTFYPNAVAAGERPQTKAAELFNAAKPWRDGDWVLWLDADEFLNIHAGAGGIADLTAFLEEGGGADGMFVQWRLMGSQGQPGLPSRLISAEMVGASHPEDGLNREVKTLWRAGPKFTGFAALGINRPLIDPARAGDVSMLLSNGTPFPRGARMNEKWLAGEDVIISRRASRRAVLPSVAQINHYSVRSADALKLKALRGRGWGEKPEDSAEVQNDRHNADFLRQMDLNDHVDDSIHRYLPALDAELARLCGLDGVAEEEAEGRRMAEETLARLSGSAAAPKEPFTPELTLPPEEGALLKAELDGVKSYLEYGSGGSTVLAAKLGVARIFSVECDYDWAENMRAALAREVPEHGHVLLHYSYVGKTGEWARPVSDRAWRHYHRYPTAIWQHPDFEHPELVLIDGRFRPACLLACCLSATRPLRVLFDDYTVRPAYHAVEAVVPLTRTVGRMAQFDIDPARIDRARIAPLMGYFTDPE